MTEIAKRDIWNICMIALFVISTAFIPFILMFANSHAFIGGMILGMFIMTDAMLFSKLMK